MRRSATCLTWRSPPRNEKKQKSQDAHGQTYPPPLGELYSREHAALLDELEKEREEVHLSTDRVQGEPPPKNLAEDMGWQIEALKTEIEGRQEEDTALRHREELRRRYAEQQARMQRDAQNMGMFGQTQAGGQQQQPQRMEPGMTGWATTENTAGTTQLYVYKYGLDTASGPLEWKTVPAPAPEPSKTPNQDWLDRRINEIRRAL